MATHACLQCGIEIHQVGSGRRRHFCSDRCKSLKVKPEPACCAGCGKQISRTKLPQGQARCKECRAAGPAHSGLTCAACAEPMWRSSTSLPQGQAMCRRCRTASAREQLQPPTQPTCRRCGQPFERQFKKQILCHNPCAPRKSGTRDHAATSTERGYGYAHMRARKEALAAFVPGDPCARCGGPMMDGDPLDLDHNDDRTGYLGLSHASCNRSSSGQLDYVRHPSVCDHCGLSYLTRWRDQRFCSVPCRRAWVKAHQKPKPAPKPAVQLMMQVCAICSAMHIGQGQTCSKPCADERARRRMRDKYRASVGIPVDPTEPTSVWQSNKSFNNRAA